MKKTIKENILPITTILVLFMLGFLGYTSQNDDSLSPENLLVKSCGIYDTNFPSNYWNTDNKQFCNDVLFEFEEKGVISEVGKKMLRNDKSLTTEDVKRYIDYIDKIREENKKYEEDINILYINK